jgi:hypothetical protein
VRSRFLSQLRLLLEFFTRPWVIPRPITRHKTKNGGIFSCQKNIARCFDEVERKEKPTTSSASVRVRCSFLPDSLRLSRKNTTTPSLSSLSSRLWPRNCRATTSRRLERQSI